LRSVASATSTASIASAMTDYVVNFGSAITEAIYPNVR
jgi:hypothetical protein